MAGLIGDILATHEDMTSWRRELHAHPEIAFEEHWTSDFVAGKLENFGLEVHRGLARTGVVGVLTGNAEGRAIALRADIDALPITELTGLPYASCIPERMHACGHDGHTTMLLGAARHLAATRDFAGTVYFIFQPAEENEGGGRVMVEEGLFTRFPAEAVFGMHNKPGVPVGHFAIRPGTMLASYDIFEITLQGTGTHAALPYTGKDAVVVAGQLIGALQTLVRANVHPVDSAVVSITQVHGGDTWNVIPATVVLRGTVRTLKAEAQDRIESAMRTMVEQTAAAHGVSGHLRYERRYPPMINHPRETELAAGVAAGMVGDDKVDRDPMPAMAAEDFAFMLQVKPGAYINIGNGVSQDGIYLHNPRYDFNDEILPLGATYWVRLAQTYLGTGPECRVR